MSESEELTFYFASNGKGTLVSECKTDAIKTVFEIIKDKLEKDNNKIVTLCYDGDPDETPVCQLISGVIQSMINLLTFKCTVNIKSMQNSAYKPKYFLITSINKTINDRAKVSLGIKDNIDVFFYSYTYSYETSADVKISAPKGRLLCAPYGGMTMDKELVGSTAGWEEAWKKGLVQRGTLVIVWETDLSANKGKVYKYSICGFTEKAVLEDAFTVPHTILRFSEENSYYMSKKLLKFLLHLP